MVYCVYMPPARLVAVTARERRPARLATHHHPCTSSVFLFVSYGTALTPRGCGANRWLIPKRVRREPVANGPPIPKRVRREPVANKTLPSTLEGEKLRSVGDAVLLPYTCFEVISHDVGSAGGAVAGSARAGRARARARQVERAPSRHRVSAVFVLTPFRQQANTEARPPLHNPSRPDYSKNERARATIYTAVHPHTQHALELSSSNPSLDYLPPTGFAEGTPPRAAILS